MTAWTVISNALVAVGAKPFATTIQALRDNLAAASEGASGAVRWVGAAMKRRVDYPVLTVTADDTANASILFDGVFIQTSASGASFVSAGTMTSVLATGTVRFKFTASVTGAGAVESRLTKNGATVNTFSGTGTKTQDIALVPTDVIELLVRRTAGSGGDTASVGTSVVTANDSYEPRISYVSYLQRDTA